MSWQLVSSHINRLCMPWYLDMDENKCVGEGLRRNGREPSGSGDLEWLLLKENRIIFDMRPHKAPMHYPSCSCFFISMVKNQNYSFTEVMDKIQQECLKLTLWNQNWKIISSKTIEARNLSLGWKNYNHGHCPGYKHVSQVKSLPKVRPKQL